MVVAFDGESAHALDKMTSQIDPGAALGAWIIGIEPDERVLRRNGQRDFEMGEEDIVGDSGHETMRTNKELRVNRPCADAWGQRDARCRSRTAS